MSKIIDIQTEADTMAFGARLAETLAPPCVVALIGTLGAGKTRLVQAVAEALGVTEEVTSPTFVLINEYATGRVPIYHLDAYRLNDEDEFIELGIEEYFAGLASAGPGLTFVEWGDRFPDCLPSDTITIRIEVLEGTARRVEINGPTQIAERL
ncbi:MAG: tRNA (adenosine(37)-N6)-threonylcarbamoyltransferase complex ATPase subunit type 1 TsaE [Planctomycetota bacterium]